MLKFEFIFALLTILTFWLLLMQCKFSDSYSRASQQCFNATNFVIVSLLDLFR